jgi:hypothetical protein
MSALDVSFYQLAPELLINNEFSMGSVNEYQ